jgi:hypothetical protein
LVTASRLASWAEAEDEDAVDWTAEGFAGDGVADESYVLDDNRTGA